jgi:hypothetical protein
MPLALIIGLSLPGAARAGDLVPIKGQGSFTATGQTIDPTTGDIIITADIAGEVSHLGRITGTATETLIAPHYVAFTIDITFVAANGDELFAVFDGAFYDAVGDSAGTFTITGGTGRFAGATGGGTFSSFDDGAEADLDGEISTVGSGK